MTLVMCLTYWNRPFISVNCCVSHNVYVYNTATEHQSCLICTSAYFFCGPFILMI